jgi:hypothetical protein
MRPIVVPIIFTISAVLFAFAPSGGIYATRTGYVSFFSHTDIEDIKADNKQASVVLNTATGDLEFGLLINAFQFDKAKMQEHFNENYMESTKFPKSTYKGKITNLSAVIFSTPGIYQVNVSGKLTMHGVTKDKNVNGTLEVKGTQIILKSLFDVAPEEYDIKIPAGVRDKIAKSIRVTVDCTLNPR